MLISIIVLSYNAADTISETLESIKAQTYHNKNLQLIIMDDFSKDRSVNIAHHWKEDNYHLFSEIKLIKNSFNHGVPANINKGWGIATGEWVKVIAADDLLEPQCIEKFVLYSIQYPDVRAIFSKVACFSDNDTADVLRELPSPWFYNFFNQTAEHQFSILAGGNFIPAPAQFLHRETVMNLNGFDGKYTLYDDYPMWLNLAYNGISLRFIPCVLVKYRIGNSISHSSENMFNLKMLEQKREYYLSNLRLKLDDSLHHKLIRLDKFIENLAEKITFKLFNNEKRHFSKITFELISLFRPVRIARKFRGVVYKIKMYLYSN
jgi:alpha-1,3-rhamnosyltransferase